MVRNAIGDTEMTSIYDQHRAAFVTVAAWIVAKNSERVATVAIKYPRDGAGRLYAYVHWIGTEMARGHAGGYGYDKGSAAVSVAARKMRETKADLDRMESVEDSDRFRTAIAKDDGLDWTEQLRRIGFDVWQAV